MTFKNKRDEAFFKALRTAGLGRNKAFKATVLSRHFRASSDMHRWSGGLLWSAVGVDTVTGADISVGLSCDNGVPLLGAPELVANTTDSAN